ncbi:MAG: tail fiber domain-containing protein [Verrucomicrobiae bacterium]|nr:tail fiber domain-containing protein [Verrucomicrobiae bacterium]
MNYSLRKAVVICLLAAPWLATATAQATPFTYQGQLKDGGTFANGEFDLQFTLFSAALGGSAIGVPTTADDTAVSDGNFTALLEFGNAAFDGSERWLEIAVRPGTSNGAFVSLSPRQQLTATPVAQFALSGNPGARGEKGDPGAAGPQGIAGAPGLKGDKGDTGATGPQGIAGAQGPKGDKGDAGAVGPAGPQGTTGAQGAKGDKGDPGPAGATGPQGIAGQPGLKGDKGDPGVNGAVGPQGPPGSVDAWSLTGNSGTNATANFIGTMDDRPLNFRTNGRRALQLSSVANIFEEGISVVVPSVGNTAVNSVGGVLFGGGMFRGGLWPNTLKNAAFGTISGGYENEIETLGQAASTISGGWNNHVLRSGFSVIGGGSSNGIENTLDGATLAYGVIAGGSQNSLIDVKCGTIPGGEDNFVSGDYGFAAGRRARAEHAGTFVWGDSTDEFFTSTAANQFLVQAMGGVGINTNAPVTALTVQTPNGRGITHTNGDVRLETYVDHRGGWLGTFTDHSLHFYTKNSSPQVTLTTAGSLGIGTQDPQFKLHVDGSAGKPGGGSWSTASDRRLKTDINDLEGALDTVLKLHPVTFRYKDPASINELPGVRTGMIAQEVEEVMPDWVEESSDGYKRVTFRGFEALTVGAVRELDAKVVEQERYISKLEEKLEQQAAEMAELRQSVGILFERTR